MGTVLLTSLADLPATLASFPVCGILLELASLIPAPAEDKKAIDRHLEIYPCAKFRFANEEALLAGETLDEFLNRCLRFSPRITRHSAREAKHISVLLSADASFADAERAVTVNASDNGFFVYSAREWTVGDRVWLKSPADETAAHGIVRYYRPWGSSTSFPGIGVEIETKHRGGQESIGAGHRELCGAIGATAQPADLPDQDAATHCAS